MVPKEIVVPDKEIVVETMSQGDRHTSCSQTSSRRSRASRTSRTSAAALEMLKDFMGEVKTQMGTISEEMKRQVEALGTEIRKEVSRVMDDRISALEDRIPSSSISQSSSQTKSSTGTPAPVDDILLELVDLVSPSRTTQEERDKESSTLQLLPDLDASSDITMKATS